jgi:hypothetical protein
VTAELLNGDARYAALTAVLADDPNDVVAQGALADLFQENGVEDGMTAALNDAVRARLLAIFPDAESLSVEHRPDGFTIRYGAMYKRPGWSTAMLFALADLFGTDAIVGDESDTGGCESCDYGSDYGHEIVVTGATKNAGRVPVGALKGK